MQKEITPSSPSALSTHPLAVPRAASAVSTPDQPASPALTEQGAPVSAIASVAEASSSKAQAAISKDVAGLEHLVRVVSFKAGSDESTAYQEHNPPTMLRKSLSTVALPPGINDRAQSPRSRSQTPRLGSTGGGRIIEKKDELHILLAVTGSVATVKLPLIIRKLKQIYQKRASIQVMVTKASTIFVDQSELPKDTKIWHDEDEWRSRTGSAEGSLHVQLRRWADILLVAPCSANSLAKFAYGICDNLITSVFRVWNPALPVLIAPAMNTLMYTNPVTKRHLTILKEAFPYVEILKPVEKVLACGDIGMGGMREWSDIVSTVVQRLGLPEDDEDDDGSDPDSEKD